MRTIKPNLELRNAIYLSGKKHAEVARELGVDPAIISHIIAGRWNLDTEEAAKLASIVGKTVDEIFPQNGVVSNG